MCAASPASQGREEIASSHPPPTLLGDFAGPQRGQARYHYITKDDGRRARAGRSVCIGSIVDACIAQPNAR